MQPGKLYGIGIGPGDPELLTLKGARLLAQRDVVFTVISQHVSASISGAVVEAVRPRGRVERLVFSMSRDRAEREAVLAANAQRIADELRAGRSCAYATLGDTLTYSTYGYMLKLLRELVPGLEAETVPGVTSFAALAARADAVLVENTEDLRVIPAFKASMAETVAFPEGSSTVLLKTYRSRNALIRRLKREKGLEVLYGERLTMEGEFISHDLDEIEARPECYFSLMLVRRP